MNELRINDLFDLDPFEPGMRSFLRAFVPPAKDMAPQIRIDVHEEPNSYAIKAEIPGVRKEDIDVRVQGNQVTISAEIKKEQEEKKDSRLLRSERQYGFASRSFTLANEVDDGKADAKYQNGVLHLTLPKRAQAANKRLAVS
jgi:HSP20 family protein